MLRDWSEQQYLHHNQVSGKEKELLLGLEGFRQVFNPRIWRWDWISPVALSISHFVPTWSIQAPTPSLHEWQLFKWVLTTEIFMFTLPVMKNSTFTIRAPTSFTSWSYSPSCMYVFCHFYMHSLVACVPILNVNSMRAGIWLLFSIIFPGPISYLVHSSCSINSYWLSGV